MLKQKITSAVDAVKTASGTHIYGHERYSEKRFSNLAMLTLRPFIPYCMHPVCDLDKSRLIFLNRDYKPLGLCTRDFVDYKDFNELQVSANDDWIKRLISKSIIKFSPLNDVGSATFYFYDDASAPKLNKKNAIAYVERFSSLYEVEGR